MSTSRQDSDIEAIKKWVAGLTKLLGRELPAVSANDVSVLWAEFAADTGRYDATPNGGPVSEHEPSRNQWCGHIARGSVSLPWILYAEIEVVVVGESWRYCPVCTIPRPS